MSDADRAFPTVPADRLDGWTRVERATRTRFQLPAMDVREHTLVYEDDRLGEAVREATGVDRTWRFFFASGLTFRPPLPPVTGPASMLPTVAGEARSGFADELRDRGVRDVSRGRTERTRTEAGDRLRLTSYRGRLPGVDGGRVDVAGWLGVWLAGDRFRLAGGGYPEAGLDVPGVDVRSGADYRDELLALVRRVE